MLVTQRRVGERLILELPGGALVAVVVRSIHRGQVRLGVVAPKDVRVTREEAAPRKEPL